MTASQEYPISNHFYSICKRTSSHSGFIFFSSNNNVPDPFHLHSISESKLTRNAEQQQEKPGRFIGNVMTTFMPVFSVTLHHSIFGLFQFLRLFCEVEQTVHSLFARIPFALLGFFRFSVPRCGICLWFPIICFRFIEISRPSSWFCQWYQFSHFQSYFSFSLDLCPFLLFSEYCPACLMSTFFAVVVWIKPVL